MKTIKIYVTKFDANDMLIDLHKGRMGLYDTWTFPIIETGENINIEIHLGHEDDQES